MKLLKRVQKYYSEFGFAATLKHSMVSVKRRTIHNKFHVFCALPNSVSKANATVSGIEVSVKSSVEEFDSQELDKFKDARGPDVLDYLRTCFHRGSKIWILSEGNNPIGFIFSLMGKTMQPYFFPLLPSDCHLYDNEVFRKFRGRGLNKVLISSVLETLFEGSCDRAFIETGIWNIAEIKSLAKTRFKMIGTARKFKAFGKHLVIWEILDSSDD